jgi:proline iminopeptidase
LVKGVEVIKEDDLNNIKDYFAPNRKINLIGHSWGAMLASAYIGRYSSRIDHTVLAEPGILTSEESLEVIRKYPVS